MTQKLRLAVETGQSLVGMARDFGGIVREFGSGIIREFKQVAGQQVCASSLWNPLNKHHGVIFIPPWTFSDVVTTLLRRNLEQRGFKTFGFGRIMSAIDDEHDAHLANLIEEVKATGITTISLIGHSLGGALAVKRASRSPDQIHQIVTVASPLGCAVYPEQFTQSRAGKDYAKDKVRLEKSMAMSASILENPPDTHCLSIAVSNDHSVPGATCFNWGAYRSQQSPSRRPKQVRSTLAQNVFYTRDARTTHAGVVANTKTGDLIAAYLESDPGKKLILPAHLQGYVGHLEAGEDPASAVTRAQLSGKEHTGYQQRTDAKPAHVYPPYSARSANKAVVR